MKFRISGEKEESEEERKAEKKEEKGEKKAEKEIREIDPESESMKVALIKHHIEHKMMEDPEIKKFLEKHYDFSRAREEIKGGK